MALEGKNKLGFIDGSILKPFVNDPKRQSWKHNNSIIASWIMNLVSKDIWNDLKIRFQKKNGPRIFKIKHDLINLKQGNLTITQYYTKVKSY
uniref:Retrotransposon gag domain-containing protein n=1 Tax=Cajanus cajan TaxID=3821 RepID=A0A151UDE8_CAJCA